MDYDVLDAFPDRDNKMKVFRPASQGKRFGNFIIDRICILVLSFGVGILLGGFMIASGSSSLDNLLANDIGVRIFDFILGAILTVIFYTLMEYYTNGKTIGKLVTNTRAIRMDNEQLTFNDALMRSLSRIVPFEPFSFLGSSLRGWHDTWTDTQVIEDDGFVTY